MRIYTLWKTDKTYKLANKSENTVEQETDGSNDLEEWLGEETPERVQLLLCVRHIGDLALGVVNSFGNGSSELFELVSFL